MALLLQSCRDTGLGDSAVAGKVVFPEITCAIESKGPL